MTRSRCKAGSKEKVGGSGVRGAAFFMTDQQRYKELTEKCGLTFDEALHALGRRTGAAPEYQRLTRNEQAREMERLQGNGLTSMEARRALGLERETVQREPPKEVEPMSWKAQKRAAKRRKEFAKYYNALVQPGLRGLKGSRK
jgi:hypothetical protein